MSPELIGILSVGAALLVGMGGIVSLNIALYRGLRADMRSDMAALRSEIRTDIVVLREDVKTDIAAVREDVKALEGRVVALDGRVVALDGRVVALDGRVVALDGRVVALEGRVVAVAQGQARLAGEIQGLFVGLGNAQAVREREPAA